MKSDDATCQEQAARGDGTDTPPQVVSSPAPFCSPFVVGDIVSIRKWLRDGVNHERVSVAGRVTRVWRSDSKSGIMVRVRTGFFRWIDLDSDWVSDFMKANGQGHRPDDETT